MARRLTLTYGLDPEKPYKLMMITNRMNTLANEEKSFAWLQGLRESARSVGSFEWDDFELSDVAGLMAVCVGNTLGTGAVTYSVKVEDSYKLPGKNIQWLPLHTYAYSFGPFTPSSIYNLIPNSVVGCQGTTAASGAVRNYKWGLFNNDVAANVPNRTAVSNEVWTSTTNVAAISLYDFIKFIEGGEMRAVSSYNQPERDLTAVDVASAVRYGTRRS